VASKHCVVARCRGPWGGGRKAQKSNARVMVIVGKAENNTEIPIRNPPPSPPPLPPPLPLVYRPRTPSLTPRCQMPVNEPTLPPSFAARQGGPWRRSGTPWPWPGAGWQEGSAGLTVNRGETLSGVAFPLYGWQLPRGLKRISLKIHSLQIRRISDFKLSKKK